MYDFYRIDLEPTKKGMVLQPDFIVHKSNDLMIRGQDFYCIWDEESGLWIMDEDWVYRNIDKTLLAEKARIESESPGEKIKVRLCRSSRSGVADEWHKFCQRQMRDNYKQLDSRIIFSNQETKKEDYASKKLPYPLEEGDHSAYDEIISTLYDPEERKKLEWAIGAVISGDSKSIQKFIVLYGEPGSGKGTFLDILKTLFDGYWNTFDAKGLTGNDQFALESFKSNPLISIQTDGNLSKIEDNSRLNALVSHETMLVNEKHKPKYSQRFNSFLFLASNNPVKITDAKSGILRRLIDVSPSGRKIKGERYEALMNRIKFELSGIAWHCLGVYKNLGKRYYDKYVPLTMMASTNDFYGFMESYFDTFDKEENVTLLRAWALYKEYVEFANVPYPFSQRQFRVELENYFKERKDNVFLDGKHYTNYYMGFRRERFPGHEVEEAPSESLVNAGSAEGNSSEGWLIFKEGPSLLDDELSECLAQYATDEGKPISVWDKVTTKLKDIKTNLLHYILFGEKERNHIVIDFDIKDENGKKCFKKNLEAALKFPKTYAELSKSGEGIHLHYIYDGDVTQLSRIYDDEIEVKVFTGKSSLRRLLTKCCNLQIAHISSGLPLKGVKEEVVDLNVVNLERSLRTTIKRCLAKEVHDSTAPNVQFIKKILDDAYKSGKPYDVSDLRQAVFNFANNSTNQVKECLRLFKDMKWQSEEERDDTPFKDVRDDELIFVDVEVFKNLFLVCWKRRGINNVVKMFNPSSKDLEPLLKMKLIGFNNLGYDNAMLYYRWAYGYSNEKLYEISRQIVQFNDRSVIPRESKKISYTDVFDFCSKKQSLKKWEIDLHEHHMENQYKWDEPVPEDKWNEIAEYCANDVIATEKVFEARQEDFKARELLADLSQIFTGTGTVNDTTNQLTTKIILRGDKNANKLFIYPDLSKVFPGYEYNPNGIDKTRYKPDTKIVKGRSLYMGEDPGEGGYVFAKPGMYRNVWTFDVASMHPSSIIAENGFGPYTENFKQLLDIRILIKHKQYDEVKKMFNGALAKYLTATDPEELKKQAKALSYALKIAINSVYGLTSASFENALRDPRNIDNWVAKRGALMMITLKNNVINKGFEVIHCKTDSIKVVDPTPEIEAYIYEFGKKYGYTFEIEAKYDRICLVNDAVYIAKESDWEGNDEPGKWSATGAQFAHPYVFKSLFSKEPIIFDDMCETKAVTTSIYLDMNEKLPEGEHAYKFVGKIGQFTPMIQGAGGGILLREKDGKYSSVTGTKGYRWMESELVKSSGLEPNIDKGYYRVLCDAAVENISKYGSFDDFVNGNFWNKDVVPDFMNIPEYVEEAEGLPFN